MAKKKAAAKKSKKLAAPVEITIEVSSGICTVTPGHADVAIGRDVTWINNTAERVIVFFPHDKVLGNLLKKAFHHSVKAGKDFTKAGPSDSALKGVHFRYAVYSQQSDCFGVGASDPEIIVR